ncbi:MAG: autotransporter outer membrane beta-barrel domain-containing protein [Blastochloris sp.]|nr:autotransporter outer membrane beta-barrel domain-containing protein [Blastochloris sp.]
MKTKTLFYISRVFVVLAALFGVNSVYASGQESLEISSFNPSFVPIQSQKSAINFAVSKISVRDGSLGSEMSGSAEAAMPGAKSEWYHSPALFADGTWTGSNDQRPTGIRNDRVGFQVGYDFLTWQDIVVGMMYGYSHDWGTVDDVFAPGTLDIETDYHTFTLYTGKNFADWVNIGGTLSATYLENESDLGGLPIASFDEWVLSPSAFVGVAHKWDKLGASSTVSYVYTNEAISPRPTNTTAYQQSTGSLLVLNKLSYDVMEK